MSFSIGKFEVWSLGMCSLPPRSLGLFYSSKAMVPKLTVVTVSFCGGIFSPALPGTAILDSMTSCTIQDGGTHNIG